MKCLLFWKKVKTKLKKEAATDYDYRDKRCRTLDLLHTLVSAYSGMRELILITL